MRLLRSTAIIGFFTLISRVLGLARDILLARFLGAGVVSDAFFTAFKLPNVFRRMFAEGAFNAAFIPLYARRLEEEGEAAATQFANEALSVLFVAVGTVIIVFEMTMPWTLAVIGFGLDRAIDPETGLRPYYLAVLYAQITMPYLLFMSIVALLSGVLNTRNYFALAAGVPIVLNLFMISALSLTPTLEWTQDRLGIWLSLAVAVSGAVQMGLLWRGCHVAGVEIKLRRPRLTPGVKRLIVLGVPGAISAGITQINLLISHSIATLQKGAASWLTYADRLYQLPLGMIGIAMGVALLPALSRRLRAGDTDGAYTSFNRAIEIAAFLTLPAAFALFAIPDTLIAGLFERGAFTAETTAQTSKALRMFALGLPAFVLLKVFTPAFFARENTRTPMIYAAMSATINVIFGIVLFLSIGFHGLALATSIAAWANVICLGVILLRQGFFIPDARLLLRLPRIIIASASMGALLYYIAPRADAFMTGSILRDFAALGAACGVGLVAYVLVSMLLRAFDMSDIRDALLRK